MALADKARTTRDLLADVRQDGEDWKRFNAGPADQIWYLRSVLEGMRKAGQTGVLMEEFAIVVKTLAALVAKHERR